MASYAFFSRLRSWIILFIGWIFHVKESKDLIEHINYPATISKASAACLGRVSVTGVVSVAGLRVFKIDASFSMRTTFR